MTTAQRDTTPPANTPAIRSFRVDVPEEDLSDLRRRITATGWLDRFAQLVDELLAALEEGEGALAPVLGTGQSRQPASCISPREREVLALVVAGRSNKEIAQTLFVSPYTVKAHVASLLTKLDADNRAQLAVMAMRRGLVADGVCGASRRRLSPCVRDNRHPAPN